MIVCIWIKYVFKPDLEKCLKHALMGKFDVHPMDTHPNKTS